jgi:N-acetylglutamate synthase-like GNAT family acetyltransferase
MIREAKTKDKIPILKFCKNTFSWGDYIEQVWDFWLSEGNLFIFEKHFPVGICHAFCFKDQVWIEGIRVDPNFRRQKIASELVMNAELVGKKKHASLSYMLIDIQNFSSLEMANSLDYKIYQTWNFYSLLPKINLDHKIQFVKSLDPKFYPHYVKSWRWFPIDDNALSQFYKDKKIITPSSFDNDSIAILTSSEHFDKTLIVTLFSSSGDSVLDILSFLQNHAVEKNFERIQILTKECLSAFDSLDYKLSFHLMKKSLV